MSVGLNQHIWPIDNVFKFLDNRKWRFSVVMNVAEKSVTASTSVLIFP
jgi:hypothetical protein